MKVSCAFLSASVLVARTERAPAKWKARASVSNPSPPPARPIAVSQAKARPAPSRVARARALPTPAAVRCPRRCAPLEIVNTSAELRGNRSLTTPCTAKCTKRVDGLPDPVAALATQVQSFRSTLNGAPSSERTRQLKDDGAALYDLLLRPAEAVISCAAVMTVEMDETWFERDCCFLYTGSNAAEHTPRLTRSASSRARGSHEAVSSSSAARTAPSLA